MIRYDIKLDDGATITIKEPCRLCKHHSKDDGYGLVCSECTHLYGDCFSAEETVKNGFYPRYVLDVRGGIVAIIDRHDELYDESLPGPHGDELWVVKYMDGTSNWWWGTASIITWLGNYMIIYILWIGSETVGTLYG